MSTMGRYGAATPVREDVDRRMAGVERYSLGKPEGFDLRVPDPIRDCAVYVLAPTKSGEVQEHATAFFVSVQSETFPNIQHIYLVTAQHVLRKPGLQLTFNCKGGTRHDPVMLPNASKWYRLDDVGVDAAALLLDVDGYEWFREAQFQAVPLENLFNSKMREQENIGIGDDLIVTGLLVSHPGTERNIPIVRAGIIAAMAGDEIRDYKDGEYGPPYRAHLIELRSTGGLSGSPVFVVLGPARPVELGSSTPWDMGGGIGTVSWRLIGLIRGHWYTGANQEDASSSALYDGGMQPVNRGIAKVVPSEDIRRLLLTGKAKSDRIERDKRRPPRDQDALDSASAGEPFCRSDKGIGG